MLHSTVAAKANQEMSISDPTGGEHGAPEQGTINPTSQSYPTLASRRMIVVTQATDLQSAAEAVAVKSHDRWKAPKESDPTC
ncbi:MAG: hypothetical protein HWD60_16505 [Defluviicoccus sp.]|nr:MAG: hypothetical protein HWD60_16505 [Defluviicoccus sp.]